MADNTNKKFGVNVIDIPRKVWLPKVKNEIRPETMYSDVDEGYFIFKRYGRAVFRAKPWTPGHRSDVIMFYAKIHEKDFQALKVNKSIPKDIKETLFLICKTYWDCFAGEGVMHTI